MDLKGLLPQKDAEEYFWALVIEPSWVQAGIWYAKEKNADVVSVSPPAAWESDEELLGACDTALSAAIQNLPEDVKEPSKVVFGVPGFWAKDGQIEPEYLEKIKKVCMELSLAPVGFVVLSEAISNLKKSQEGSSLSALVVGVTGDQIEISLFKSGNLEGTTQVARSVSLVDDLVEGLTRFDQIEPFPSRIILYDGKEGELEDDEQMLIEASWEKYEKVKFLHTPKVEVVSPDGKVLATALAGGLELGSVENVSYQAETNEEGQLTNDTVENITKEDAGDLGFVVGEDIKRVSGQILDTDRAAPSQERVNTSPISTDTGVLRPPRKNIFAGFAVGINKFLSKLKVLIPKKDGVIRKGGQGVKESRNLLVVGIAALLILVVGGFLFWWYYPKATVTIYLSPQKLDQKEEVIVSTSSTNVDLDKMVLPGKVVEVAVSGEKSGDATGTKLVGDRAKGEVTIYRSGPEVTLDAGTKIKSADNLAFSLDDEVTVASGSASTPGTTKVNVTAVDIGANYNLASGTSFSVGNYPSSDIEAKNESAFSGGSSREINAVSQEDQDTLLSSLSDELKGKAVSQAQSDLGDGEYLIKESYSFENASKEFSAKVGDEASTFKLTLSQKVSFVSVKNEDLLLLAKDRLKAKVSSGYALRDDQIQVTFDFADSKDEEYNLEADFSANLLPQTNPDEIVKKIAGKYPTLAQEYLSSIEGFKNAEVTLKPHFPGKLGTLPRVAKNISIEFEAAR